MNDRLRAMKRILAVQEQAKRLAEWQLFAIENRKRDIAAAQQDLDRFTESSALTGPLASVAVRSGRRLATRSVAAEAEHVAQTEVAREARSQVKLAGRMVEDLARDDRRVQERRDLERLIEAVAARPRDPDASLP